MRGQHFVRRVLATVLIASGLLLAGCDTSDTPLTFAPTTLPDGRVGQPYEVQITATYPAGSISDLPFTTTGTLPPGLEVYRYQNGIPGGIRGTPTTAGSYGFTMKSAGYCTMGGCVSGEHDYTIVVAP